jgi:hypothetical protein
MDLPQAILETRKQQLKIAIGKKVMKCWPHLNLMGFDILPEIFGGVFLDMLYKLDANFENQVKEILKVSEDQWDLAVEGVDVVMEIFTQTLAPHLETALRQTR